MLAYPATSQCAPMSCTVVEKYLFFLGGGGGGGCVAGMPLPKPSASQSSLVLHLICSVSEK